MSKISTNKAFSAYKPLRNYLRDLRMSDALAVIRAYSQHSWMGQKFPRDIQIDPLTIKKGSIVINNWDLEILAREIIINSPEVTLEKRDLKKRSDFAKAINHTKDFNNTIYKIYNRPSDIITEIHRIAHRQFPWQTNGFDQVYITRYFKIFSHPPLANILETKIRLTTRDLYTIGTALSGVYLDKFALNYPPSIDLGELDIDQRKLDIFLGLFSLTSIELRKKLTDTLERRMDERFLYYHDSLKSYPLIRIDIAGQESIICPMPALLFWRFTNGIYYNLYEKPGFDNAFGEAFETYVGDVLQASNDKKKVSIYPEEKVNADENPKIDWIVDEETSALFIECKTKRLIMPAKVELYDLSHLDRQLSIIADAVVQVYKTVQYYADNRYLDPKYKYDPQKQIFPVVVVLEDWFLMGDFLFRVQQIVAEKMKEVNLPTEWLDEMPFTIMSVQELEQGMQIIQQKSINTVMGGKVFDQEMRTWGFTSYLRERFSEELKNNIFLFSSDFEKLSSLSI